MTASAEWDGWTDSGRKRCTPTSRGRAWFLKGDPTLHYQIGAVGVSLFTRLGALRRQYQDLYAPFAVEEPEDDAIRIEVRRTPVSLAHRRRYEILANGHPRFVPSRFDSVLPHVEWAVSWELPRTQPQFLQLHASVMEVNGTGVIFPGAAGVGKSTLTLGLLTRGWHYLCDEFALIHCETGRLHPYPRAICIKEPGFAVVRGLGVELAGRNCYSKGSKGSVTLINPQRLWKGALGRDCPLRFVVFPKYAPGAKPALVPIARAEAAFALHEVCFNLLQCNRLGLDVLTQAIRGAECYRLVSGELHSTCDLLERVVGRSEAADDFPMPQEPRYRVETVHALDRPIPSLRGAERTSSEASEPRASASSIRQSKTPHGRKTGELECRPKPEPDPAIGAANLHMLHELDRWVAVLGRAGIDVMLLKGAALNRTLYERPDLRPMSDLDLLVRPTQALEAVSALLSHGCRRGRPLIRDDFFPRFHYELELLGPLPRPVRIDLHARPFRPLRIARTMPDDALWAGAVKIPCGEGEAFLPRPEFMFVHLAAHAAFHGCARAIWLYDLRRFFECHASSLDWSFIVECCRRWRLGLAVLRAVHRAEEAYGPVCPPLLKSELAACPFDWRDRLTLAHAPRDAGSPLLHLAVNWLCTPGLSFRLSYAWAHVMPGLGHLGECYAFRHRGWPVAAAVWRALRGASRVAWALAWPVRAVAGVMLGVFSFVTGSLRRVGVGISNVHGRGVFARRGFASGAVIGRYRGRKTDREGRFTVSRHLRDGNWRRYDLQPPFRFLNHSLEPNAQISRESRIVRALRPIARGEEITIDYGAEMRWCSQCGAEHLVPRSVPRAVEKRIPSLECVA